MSLKNDKHIFELSKFVKENGTSRKLRQGPIDIREFSDDDIFFIKSGYIVAEIGFEKSKNKAIIIFGPNDLARQELLISSDYSNVIYKALTRCTLYTIDKNLLESEAEKNL